tara:strand:- start:78 stop:260 length:183 start_codon:yes stop_codon:yes gene_type:complete
MGSADTFTLLDVDVAVKVEVLGSEKEVCVGGPLTGNGEIDEVNELVAELVNEDTAWSVSS